MAEAAGLGVKIFQQKIAIQPETAKISSFFQIDPLQLISSGALLIAAEPDWAKVIIDSLRKQQIQACIIGEFIENPSQKLLKLENGGEKVLQRPTSDALWSALSKRKR